MIWKALVSLHVFPSITTRYDSVLTAPFHPRVHNIGNTGIGGVLHARGARFATRMIDLVAYQDVNMRELVAEGLHQCLYPGASILDVGCGVGTMTRELLQKNFCVTGVDASQEMVSEAQHANPRAAFHVLNAISVTREHASRAAVVCMVFHEMPPKAHRDVVLHLLSVAEEVWVIDVEPSYQPSDAFLFGEPYLDAYLCTIEDTMHGLREHDVATFEVIPGRVRGWVVRKKRE